MNSQQSRLGFLAGAKDSVPIALGYLAVSFGFGITVINKGLRIITGVIISLTNLTSAGQIAGLEVIVNGGAIWEMILCQLIINIRYSLMGISLTQKLDSSFGTLHRMLLSFVITDEIFGVASSKKEINVRYMYGLGSLPLAGWTIGTLLGAVLGDVLPDSISGALGIAIYGMFIAIVMPEAKKNKGIFAGVLLACGLSCFFYFAPFMSFISSSTAIVICALISAVIISVLFPVPEDTEKEENEA